MEHKAAGETQENFVHFTPVAGLIFEAKIERYF
jgi:hypothetical protein